MAVWEFALAFDDGGVRLGQTVVADGADEPTAAQSAASVVAEHPGLVLQRPGLAVAADVEARWREVCGDRFPAVMSDTGRLALYARGLPDPSRTAAPAPPPPRFSWATRRAVRRTIARGGNFYEMVPAMDGGQTYEMTCKICGEYGNVMASGFDHARFCPVGVDEARPPRRPWWRRLLRRIFSH